LGEKRFPFLSIPNRREGERGQLREEKKISFKVRKRVEGLSLLGKRRGQCVRQEKKGEEANFLTGHHGKGRRERQSPS